MTTNDPLASLREKVEAWRVEAETQWERGGTSGEAAAFAAVVREIDRQSAALAQQAAAGGDVELPRIIAFLLGEDAYAGFWFGEVPLGEHQYWWRKHLREHFSAATPPAAPDGGAVQRDPVLGTPPPCSHRYYDQLGDYTGVCAWCGEPKPTAPAAPDGHVYFCHFCGIRSDRASEPCPRVNRNTYGPPPAQPAAPALNPAQQQLAHELDQCIAILEGQPAAPAVDVEALCDYVDDALEARLGFKSRGEVTRAIHAYFDRTIAATGSEGEET